MVEHASRGQWAMALLCASLAGCTHARDCHASASAPDALVSSTYQAPATEAFTAEQLLLGVLELIKNLDKADQLTLGRLSEAMRQPARAFGPGHAGYGGRLTDHWSFALELKRAETKRARLDLDFIDTTPEQSSVATDICALDFIRFASALKAAGFMQTTIYGEHGRIAYEMFARQDLGVVVDTAGEASTTSILTAHRCVRHVTVQ